MNPPLFLICWNLPLHPPYASFSANPPIASTSLKSFTFLLQLNLDLACRYPSPVVVYLFFFSCGCLNSSCLFSYTRWRWSWCFIAPTIISRPLLRDALVTLSSESVYLIVPPFYLLEAFISGSPNHSLVSQQCSSQPQWFQNSELTHMIVWPPVLNLPISNGLNFTPSQLPTLGATSWILSPSTIAPLPKLLIQASCSLATPAFPSACPSHYDYFVSELRFLVHWPSSLSPNPSALFFHALFPYPAKISWPVISVTLASSLNSLAHTFLAVSALHLPSCFLFLFLH